MLYFIVTTLSTVGYGDILPINYLEITFIAFMIVNFIIKDFWNRNVWFLFGKYCQFNRKFCSNNYLKRLKSILFMISLIYN